MLSIHLKAFFTTIILSFVKESGDEMYKFTGLPEHSFWDRRGFDIDDIARAGFGGVCYLTIKVAL